MSCGLIMYLGINTSHLRSLSGWSRSWRAQRCSNSRRLGMDTGINLVEGVLQDVEEVTDLLFRNDERGR